MDFERAFVAAGGLLMAGLDPTGNGGVVAGFGDLREVELLVEAGLHHSKQSRSRPQRSQVSGEDSRIVQSRSANKPTS